MIALHIKYIALMFTSNEKSQSFSSQSSIVPWWTKPTALNNTSTFSKVFTNSKIALLSVESNVWTLILGYSLFKSAKVLSFKSVAVTSAPSLWNAMNDYYNLAYSILLYYKLNGQLA